MTPEQVEAVARYVRARRKALAKPRARIAATSGVSVRLWQKVEGGEGPVTEVSLRQIAMALGESPTHLLALAGYPPDEPPADAPVPPGLATKVEDLATKVDVLTELVTKHLLRGESPGI